MKLLLKHLAPYLPYGLRFVYQENSRGYKVPVSSILNRGGLARVSNWEKP